MIAQNTIGLTSHYVTDQCENSPRFFVPLCAVEFLAGLGNRRQIRVTPCQTSFFLPRHPPNLPNPISAMLPVQSSPQK
jgi:hypothetical protein